jgi:hypothetical protein
MADDTRTDGRCSRGCCDSPRDHWRSVAVSATATPTRRPGAARKEKD